MSEPASSERSEHIAWCKERALAYLDRGDLVSALASMASDIDHHPGTREMLGIHALMMIGMMLVVEKDAPGLRRWIEGFR